MIQDEEIVPEELNSTTRAAKIKIGAELFRLVVGRSEFVDEKSDKEEEEINVLVMNNCYFSCSQKMLF